MFSLVWSLWGEFNSLAYCHGDVIIPIASIGFLTDYLPMDKKALAMYPIFLFYFAISCLILAQNQSLY